VDRDSIYRTDREPSVQEQLRGQEPKTQFGRAMEELGVQIILAHSPQAKGRVERRNGLFQDRLVKELRLRGISDLKQANEFLERTFLPQLHRRFTVQPAQTQELHRPAPKNLSEVLSWQEERVVGQDWVVAWERRWFQIERAHESLCLAGKRVTVRQLQDGKVQLLYEKQKLRCKELPARPEGPAAKKKPWVEPKPCKPGLAHPWRQFGFGVGQEFWRGKKRAGRQRQKAGATGR